MLFNAEILWLQKTRLGGWTAVPASALPTSLLTDSLNKWFPRGKIRCRWLLCLEPWVVRICMHIREGRAAKCRSLPGERGVTNRNSTNLALFSTHRIPRWCHLASTFVNQSINAKVNLFFNFGKFVFFQICYSQSGKKKMVVF